jgi:hypothetical protein
MSVLFPNAQLCYRKRREQPDRRWVVLRIDPAILPILCGTEARALLTLEAEGRILAMRGDFPT